MPLKNAYLEIEIEYEGTRYRGWQIQHNAKTVQGELDAAARSFFRRRSKSAVRAEPTRAFTPSGKSRI
jgi:tRNA U38,U39,U40 pseudouridine synthase TruA